MTRLARVLAIDLGTSSVKVGLINGNLHVLATSSTSYSTFSDEPGMAEQRPSHWLDGIQRAVLEALEANEDGVDAVVLTAQMPTLVALDLRGDVIGNAVTWQDSRADALVDSTLDSLSRRRVRDLSGTPVDGRYVIPMHLRRVTDTSYSPATLLSAKDFLFFSLTGELVTDPSTASGFASLEVATGSWSAELSDLWGVGREMLPTIANPNYSAALSDAGSKLLPGVKSGTPVVVGSADSVCAHHFVTSFFGDSISVIDGSSTVIMASLEPATAIRDEMLVTPLVNSTQRGVELDLLATGSSVAWLAALLEMTPAALEELALVTSRAVASDVLFFPYLAGGEQGVLWRTDILGTIGQLTLGVTRGDLALALFEGIAIETLRCVELLTQARPVERVVSCASSQGRGLGASLIAALLDVPVIALDVQSPSLLGAALIALEKVGSTSGDLPAADTLISSPPQLDHEYRAALAVKVRRYLELAPRRMA